MKVALVYDRVNKWGGAERVLLALHELFPDAPLYTSVYHKKNALWADAFTVQPSFLQHIPFLRSHHEVVPFLMPMAFEQFVFDAFDLVISLTSESAKGILTKPTTKHICYCLTPTRYLWSGYEEYFPSPIMRCITKPIISYLRSWDGIAASRPDSYVAISREVQQRIKTYYHRESSVIYPPLTLSPMKTDKLPPKKGEFFLIVSRLSKFTKYKRIDLAIEACNRLQLPLVIVGEGSWRKELEGLSGPTITFVGNVTDTNLVSYYRRSKALLFPGVEDFGLAIVESQRYGKPVIAYRGGGALETVCEGKTGIFFDTQSVSSLMSALQQFEKMIFSPINCKKQAEKFDFDIFKTQFYRLVNNQF